MKNINKLICAFMIVSFFGCNDAIEIDQPGRLGAENAFASVSDLQAGLLGAYNFLDTTSEIGFSAAFTDESHRGRDNGGQNVGIQNFNINTNSGYASNIWLSNYGAIGTVNRILEAAGTINPGDEENEYNNILGQAYAIRAFSMFQILTYFSTDYTDDNALAGILVTQPATDIFADQPRSTNGEFYDQIESDLASASDLITGNNGSTFMGQDFITALRARIATYRRQYTVADAHAASLLESYPIATPAQYQNMYLDTDFTEVIFSLERTINDSYDNQGTAGFGWAGSLFAFVDSTAGGGPFMEISRATFNLLDGTGDVRLDVAFNAAESTVDPGYDGNNNYLNQDVLLVQKYPGSGGQPLLNDLKVFRSAEMLLIRAEAAAAATDLVSAATFIKELRDARIGPGQDLPTYANQTEAFGDILDERRLEFLFEGHRYVDLKRLGDRGDRNIDRDPWECSFLSACTLSNTDYRFTLPIPLSEITANSAAEQNPGY